MIKFGYDDSKLATSPRDKGRKLRERQNRLGARLIVIEFKIINIVIAEDDISYIEID